MWISPAYERDYREWMVNGHFEGVLTWSQASLTDALAQQHPTLIASALWGFSTCYHTRGAVALLEKQASGWRDIQAGYWADVYALRFEIISVTQPAWSQASRFIKSNELVTTLAFARLFGQTADRDWLEQAVASHYKSGPHISDGQPGGVLLSALRNPSSAYSRRELFEDRRACCRGRDAYPKRPTEVVPVGVIDLENILHYPSDAAFQYSMEEFLPTEDHLVTESIVAYHTWYPQLG